MKKNIRWIALLGVDGTGKSTVLRELQSALSELPYRGIKVFHRRPGVAYRTVQNPAVPVPHYGKPAYGSLASVLKLLVMVLDWHFGYWLRIRKQVRQGYLVIADRHSLLDLLADPLRYRYGGPRWLVQAFIRLVPMPDLVLLLNAPLEVLLARKSEIPADKLAELSEAYLRLSKQMSNFRVIDASQPLEDVVASVKERLQPQTPSANGKAPAEFISSLGKVNHEK